MSHLEVTGDEPFVPRPNLRNLVSEDWDERMAAAARRRFGVMQRKDPVSPTCKSSPFIVANPRSAD